MGKYLNPGNDAFCQAANDDIYVDKTMLIACMNKKIDKESSKYVCVNRPRRFGKSMAANMLLPKREYPEKPALLIELKWDKTAEAAIKQIKKRKYTEALETYKGDILLVGVNYSKKRAKHECVIERKSYEVCKRL